MQNILSRLKTARRVAIFTHQRPDPDALGSQAAAAHILKHLGATEIFLMQFTDAPAPYRFLQQNVPAEIATWDSEWAGSAGGLIDTILAVDTCTYSQMEPAAAFLKAEHSKVCAIDHHLSRDDLGPVIFADTDAASCTEILFDLAKLSGAPLTPEIAQPLMAGLVGDTGWFRFDSVTRRTHTMAGELAALCPSDALYEKLQQTETKTKLALMQRALASIQWHANDKAAVMVLKQKDFSDTGATLAQTEYVVDLPMMVGTCEVTALLTEMSDGRSRLSLRSKRNVDVNKICRQFDGGGHAKAAGARFDIPIEQARDAVTAAILAAL
jgi:phosphoesterase RecJ-like protein